MSKIRVSGTEITVITQNDEDYICLTDMVANIEDGAKLIERWLNTKTTVDFLGVWEQLNNKNFKTPEFRGIRENVGSGSYFLSVKNLLIYLNLRLKQKNRQLSFQRRKKKRTEMENYFSRMYSFL